MTVHIGTFTFPLGTDATQNKALLEPPAPDDAGSGPVIEKLQDALTPGYQAEFDPAEAEAAGAFQEDALSEADALASTHDTAHFASEPEIIPLFAPARTGKGVGLVIPGALDTPVKE
jgi:hypothetical protein